MCIHSGRERWRLARVISGECTVTGALKTDKAVSKTVSEDERDDVHGWGETGDDVVAVWSKIRRVNE